MTYENASKVGFLKSWHFDIPNTRQAYLTEEENQDKSSTSPIYTNSEVQQGDLEPLYSEINEVEDNTDFDNSTAFTGITSRSFLSKKNLGLFKRDFLSSLKFGKKKAEALNFEELDPPVEEDLSATLSFKHSDTKNLLTDIKGVLEATKNLKSVKNPDIEHFLQTIGKSEHIIQKSSQTNMAGGNKRKNKLGSASGTSHSKGNPNQSKKGEKTTVSKEFSDSKNLPSNSQITDILEGQISGEAPLVEKVNRSGKSRGNKVKNQNIDTKSLDEEKIREEAEEIVDSILKETEEKPKRKLDSLKDDIGNKGMFRGALDIVINKGAELLKGRNSENQPQDETDAGDSSNTEETIFEDLDLNEPSNSKSKIDKKSQESLSKLSYASLNDSEDMDQYLTKKEFNKWADKFSAEVHKSINDYMEGMYDKMLNALVLEINRPLERAPSQVGKKKKEEKDEKELAFLSKGQSETSGTEEKKEGKKGKKKKVKIVTSDTSGDSNDESDNGGLDNVWNFLLDPSKENQSRKTKQGAAKSSPQKNTKTKSSTKQKISEIDLLQELSNPVVDKSIIMKISPGDSEDKKYANLLDEDEESSDKTVSGSESDEIQKIDNSEFKKLSTKSKTQLIKFLTAKIVENNPKASRGNVKEKDLILAMETCNHRSDNYILDIDDTKLRSTLLNMISKYAKTI